LNRTSAVLTTDKLIELNVQFSEKKRNAIDIADDFLRSNGLLA
jgi:osmoprotectant transport system substrate-binding protein